MAFRNRPTFFVIGAQRAGTTRLCHLLDRHPEIAIPTKEPFYFQDPAAMETKRDWYESLFANAPRASIYGEGSTYYSMCESYPGTAQRIHDFHPGAKIVYMVRHPLRRIESAWYQLLSTREIGGLKTFKHAILDSDLLIEPTLYWRQLSEYRRFFPDTQIFVGVFEDFARDEDALLRPLLRFLGVDDRIVPAADAEAAFNESASKLQPWLVVDLIKSVPGYQSFKHVVPEPMRALIGDRLQKPIRVQPAWDAELVEYVVARVGEDAHSLLEHLGLSPTHWDLYDVPVAAA